MRIAILMLSMFAVGAVEAQEFPSLGLLYNRQEDSSINYECNKTSEGKLKCDFVQTSVRKKQKPSDLDGKLEQARGQFSAALKEISEPKQCQMVRALVDGMKGTLSPDELLKRNPGLASDRAEFIKGIEKSRALYREHPDEIAIFEAFDAFCQKKDEDSFLDITRREHEKNVRSCRVSSNPFKQTFTWIESYVAGKGAWVVEGQPEGPCGVVQLSRFESVETKIGASKFTNWRYVARKAVTNPDGELLPGQKCGAVLDQSEYVYDWKETRSQRVGCEFIEFSPF